MSALDRRRRDLPNAFVMFARGFAKRCPRCGQGHLWRHWFSLLERCPRCGLLFERGEGYFLGGMAVNIGITEALFGVLVVALALLTWPNVPWGWVLAIGLTFNAVFPAAFYPYSKMIFVAIDLLLLPRQDRAWSEPAGMSPDHR